MCRGNHRADIFREEEDYTVFLHLIKDAQSHYPFLLHSYCLMTNHIHLQLETLEKEIWHIMQRICLIYTKYFNEKYQLVGHLFQGRYHAVIIEDEAYLLQTSRYIHLNPVKACMVDNPADYQWSSYPVYLEMKMNSLLTVEKVLGYFQNNSRELYQKYVEDFSHIDYREKDIQESMGENELWLPW